MAEVQQPPQPSPPEAPGAQLRRLHAHLPPALQEFSALVADYIDGVWLPEGEAPGRRAVMLGRRLVAHETERQQLEAAGARAEARAASAEAQLAALLAEAGGSVRLREELGEMRAAYLALQQAMGESMGAQFEAHRATLAEENADLRVQLAARGRELEELRDVLKELRRSGGQEERVELDIAGERSSSSGGSAEGAALRKVNQAGKE